MKITKIETFLVDAGWRPWIFVKVETDDHVILFLIDKRRIQDVERLFQVGISFF